MKHLGELAQRTTALRVIVGSLLLQVSTVAVAATEDQQEPNAPAAPTAAAAQQASATNQAPDASAPPTSPAPASPTPAPTAAPQPNSAPATVAPQPAPAPAAAPAPVAAPAPTNSGASTSNSSASVSSTPAVAPTPAPTASASASTETVAVAEPSVQEGVAAPVDEGKSLIPPGEKERVSEDAVDVEKSKYRPGKGAQIGSKDGRFNLVTRVRAQMRYTVNSEESENEDGDVERENLHRFQIRRARLQFIGHVFNKHNKFKTELAFSPRDLGMKDGNPTRTPLLTWYFEFDHLDQATLRMGQYKLPFSRQRVISSGNLMMVDRALANGEFNVDRDIGLDLRSKDLFRLGKKLRYYAGIYMGEGRDQFEYTDFGMHYLARLEYLPFGDFKDYSESDFKREKKPKLSIGGAVSYIDDAKKNRGILGKTPTDGGTTDITIANADFMFKWAGASLSSEFFWRRGKRKFGDLQIEDDMGELVDAAQEKARDGYGLFVQGGYLLPRLPIELAARYSFARPTDKDESSLTAKDEAGAAVSWYIAHHPLKLQADYFRSWEDQDTSIASDTFRIQLQLAF